MKIARALRGVHRLGIDTAPVIYYVESHPDLGPLCLPFFTAIANGTIESFTSTVTLLEALVLPLKNRDAGMVAAFQNILRHSEISLIEVSSDIAERAAELRVRYSLRTPDAIQVATALEKACEAFLTNDAGLKRITEIRIIVVSELIP